MNWRGLWAKFFLYSYFKQHEHTHPRPPATKRETVGKRVSNGDQSPDKASERQSWRGGRAGGEGQVDESERERERENQKPYREGRRPQRKQNCWAAVSVLMLSSFLDRNSSFLPTKINQQLNIPWLSQVVLQTIANGFLWLISRRASRHWFHCISVCLRLVKLFDKNNPAQLS